MRFQVGCLSKIKQEYLVYSCKILKVDFLARFCNIIWQDDARPIAEQDDARSMINKILQDAINKTL